MESSWVVVVLALWFRSGSDRKALRVPAVPRYSELLASAEQV
jgi:hypothetical protein